MIALYRATITWMFLVTMLAFAGVGDGRAQSVHTSADAPASTTKLAEELRQFGDIELIVFKNRAEFLDLVEQRFGSKHTGIPDKLPRSPFTVTGRDGDAHLGTCRVFVPSNITPDTGDEVFARLMHNWFGTRLSYATSAALTYRWLIFHEARHCQPDHFGGDVLKDHRDEVEADLFAHEQLASTSASASATDQNALARDIIAFRIITSALIAGRSHMIGLSVQQKLQTPGTPPTFTAQQEINAFLAARKLVIGRAKTIATAVNPTNRELVRAIIELNSEVDPATTDPQAVLVRMVITALDDAIAHFAPALHQSVATLQSNGSP